MPPSNGVKQFPDLSNKLAAPKKGTVFERQKQEAEAKRLREEAETAAVYDDFVKSFEDDDASSVRDNSSGLTALRAGPKTGANRHFVPTSKKSGPGSLGPSPSLAVKRNFDGSSSSRQNARSLLQSEDTPFRQSDEEDEHLTSRAAERAVARPTIQMSSLPPGISPAVIRSLLPDGLVVDDVRVLRSTGNATDRKSDSAIITFANDTAASSIDAAVSSLQNRYLERGFHLSLSRHLSSATLSASGDTGAGFSSTALPFGAKIVQPSNSLSLRNAAPPPSHSGRFAPPSSYSSSSRSSSHVPVKAPRSLSQVRLINKTVEEVLLRGPEFEALLMTRPQVRREERWAFLWNARSEAGIWYRWRLWEILSGTLVTQNKSSSDATITRNLFEGSAPWVESSRDRLVYEFVTGLDEVTQDSKYDSSDEFESGDENGVPKTSHKYAAPGVPEAGPDLSNLSMDDDSVPRYLSPTQRARLVYLLFRLPPTSAKLRRGDVARVTGFAIAHSGAGAEEVADLLVSNAVQPLSASERLKESQLHKNDIQEAGQSADKENRSKDFEIASQSILVGLHILSDLLSASSTSGIRHSWKYRQLIHSNLTRLSVFRHLGHIEHSISKNVGRIRAEKWHRSIRQGVLGLWETWGVFMGEEMAEFVREYEAGAKDHSEEAGKDNAAHPIIESEKKESRWRAVDADADVNVENRAYLVDRLETNSPREEIQVTDIANDNVQDALQDDEDGEDIDGIPMEEESDESDADGRSTQSAEIVDVGKSDSDKAMSSDKPEIAPLHSSGVLSEVKDLSSSSTKLKQRPRAVDMFNSSDEDNVN